MSERPEALPTSVTEKIMYDSMPNDSTSKTCMPITFLRMKVFLL